MERKIAASILSADLLHLGDELGRVRASGADWLHFDVMDGIFVDNISFGIPVLKACAGAGGLYLDVHLMIQDPLRYVDVFAGNGADRITFHLESVSDPFRTLDAIHRAGVQAGLALRPATPARAVLPFLDAVDMLLVMTVEPGFGGQGYIPEMTQKVREVRALLGDRPVDVQVDGGIDAATAPEAARAGANVLVSGSYLFRQMDMKSAVDILRRAGGDAV